MTGIALKGMEEKNVFDFYEITGDKLALYYRQFKSPKVIKTDKHKWWVKATRSGSTLEIFPGPSKGSKPSL
jgi:hypothetical protein